MLYPVPFKAEHFYAIPEKESWGWVRGATDLDGLRTLEGPHALTLMEDGKPIAAVGVVPYWEDRGHLWTFISAGAERKVHRFAKWFLAGVPMRRIEAAVEANFTTGCRWAERLGFVRETAVPARAFWPNGLDAHLYALVR
jgi:hypothetical protein